jgi:hypothetical protein
VSKARGLKTSAVLLSLVLAGIAIFCFLVAFRGIDLTPPFRHRMYWALGGIAILSYIHKVWTPGKWPFLAWAVPAACVLIASATAIVEPSNQITGLGQEYYVRFSRLEFSGPLANRVVTPLLARITFLYGPKMHWVVQALTLVFPILLIRFFYLRISPVVRGTKRKLYAIIAAGVITLSSITFFQLSDPSNPNITTYVLVVLFLLTVRSGEIDAPAWKTWAKVGLYCLIAANHENGVFIFPFLVLYAAGSLHLKVIAREAALLLPGLALLAFLMGVVASLDEPFSDGTTQFDNVKDNFKRTTDLLLSFSFYRPILYPVALSFTLAWALAVVTFATDLVQRNWYRFVLMASGILVPAIQFFIAGGWARYGDLMFPVIAISILALFSWRRYGAALVCSLAILNPIAWHVYSVFANLEWLTP